MSLPLPADPKLHPGPVFQGANLITSFLYIKPFEVPTAAALNFGFTKPHCKSDEHHGHSPQENTSTSSLEHWLVCLQSPATFLPSSSLPCSQMALQHPTFFHEAPSPFKVLKPTKKQKTKTKTILFISVSLRPRAQMWKWLTGNKAVCFKLCGPKMVTP